MEVRPGYKRTEVGIIPDDWQPRAVGEMGHVLTGKALAVNAPGEQRPYLRTKNVFDGRIDIDDVLTMPMTDAQFRQFMVLNGDVLLNEGQSLELVGRCAIYQGQYPEPCAIQNQLLRFRAHQGVSGVFASHLFRHCQHTGVFSRIALQTTSIAHLGGKRFEQLLLQWPPTEGEQCSIAAVLSDADALLEGLTQLIAKKRDIKQAAMQQLLTGQTRLPGFDGEWEAAAFGDIAAIRNSKIVASATPAGTQCIELESIGQGTGRLLGSIDASGWSSKYSFTKGDVLFGRLRAYLRKYWLATFDGICSTEIWPLIPRDDRLVGSFLHLLVQTNAFVNAACVSYGTHMPRSDWSVLRQLPMQVPSPREQTAIATVLSDMDEELSALEVRRDKTRALKQAMMQELLTGKTRLVEPAMVADAVDSAKTNGRPANVHFKRSVLAAEIVDRLHEEPTFGHVKFEKLIFLVEHLCKIDTGSTYHRDAAGPYDNRAMRSIDSQLRKQKWFDAQELNGRYRYVPMAKRGGHKEYFERYFGGVRDSFERTLSTLRAFDTERCEIIATLFAAWNDLMKQHASVSDETIVHEVLNNWHESKRRIPEERWRKALSWMRDKGFVPHQATGELS